MKARVLQDTAPVYPQMGADAIATRILHRGDEVNLGGIKAEGPRKWVEVTLPDAADAGALFTDLGVELNERGNVLGLMPHPERCTEHVLGNEDGRLIFLSMLKSLKGNKKQLKMAGAG